MCCKKFSEVLKNKKFVQQIMSEDLRKKSYARMMRPVNIYKVTRSTIFDKSQVKEACKEIERKEKIYKKKSKKIENQLLTESFKRNGRCNELLVINLLYFDKTTPFFYNSVEILNGNEFSDLESQMRREFIYRFLISTMQQLILLCKEQSEKELFEENQIYQISMKFLQLDNIDFFSNLDFLDDLLILWNKMPVLEKIAKENIDLFNLSLFEYFVSNIQRYKEKNFKLTKYTFLFYFILFFIYFLFFIFYFLFFIFIFSVTTF